MDQPNRPKLLLADDSVTIRKVVELTFADEGIEVTTVGDSATAMTRFVEIQPDIVLVDAGLDGTSGYQICEMIKSDDATRHIPVLLLIGSFEPFDQDEAERVGADGFLTKPFHSIRDLVARVWDLLGRETSVPEPAPAVVDAFGADHESLEHISADLTAMPASAEDDDIEDLYRSSFEETVEIDEYDTVDDMLGDSALDDEMIEASYPTDGYTNDLNGLIPDAEPASEAVAGLDEPIADTKEFDWSPAAVVSEPVESVVPAFEPKFVFDETSDETTEAGAETPHFERIVDEENLGLEALIGISVAPAAEAETTEELAAAEAVIEEHEVTEIEERHAEPTEPEIWPEVESSRDENTEPQLGAITPEMLDLIVEKVVARLSDQVIREVALEAVPRIAEKLIREALSDTGRSNVNKEAKETAA